MARIEVLNTWFFPSKLRDGGTIQPAPPEAAEKYRELRDGWMKNHPRLPHEIPMVSLGPRQKQGEEDNSQEGYLVETKIMYR